MEETKYCIYCGKSLIRKYLENNDRLYCKNCDRIIYENPLPACANINFDGEGNMLLVKRKKAPHIGKWCLPGGFIEFGEAPDKAALRELKEETNFDGEIIALFDVLSDISPLYGPVILVSYRVKIINGEMAPGDDASDVRYFGEANLPVIAFHSHQILIERAFDKSIPS